MGMGDNRRSQKMKNRKSRQRRKSRLKKLADSRHQVRLQRKEEAKQKVI